MATRPSLEDLLKDIPRQKLNQPCRDDHLSKIALSLTDWQSVAPFLGLLKVDIEEIEREHVKVRPQKLAMLWKWREKFGRKAKYRKLTSVFWDLERTDLVEKLCELLQAENGSSSSDEDDSSAAKKNFPSRRHETEHPTSDKEFNDGVQCTIPMEETTSSTSAVVRSVGTKKKQLYKIEPTTSLDGTSSGSGKDCPVILCHPETSLAELKCTMVVDKEDVGAAAETSPDSCARYGRWSTQSPTVAGDAMSNVVNHSLEGLLKDIPPVKLDQPCRDDHLSKVGLSLTDWQSVAPFLGLTEADEREITTRYPIDLTMQNIAMLQKWKSKFSENAMYKTLINVLWNRGKTSLAEQVCTMVSKGQNTTAERGEKSTLDSYAEYLRGRYKTGRPTFFTLQWPPPPTRKVFKLAIIGHQTMQRGQIDEELVRLTLSGNVDDIMKRETEVKLESLFSLDEEEHKVILIEGAPGAGKSTLSWHICQKWESGELFQGFKVVVFVQLQDPNIQSATSLVDILPVESEIMRKEVLSELLSCRGESVLFVLDGWDEYRAGLQAGSLFRQLIRSPEKVNMHFSSLIITSRPIASGVLQRYASTRVEIVGFTSAEVKQYFTESIGDCETEQKLHKHLRVRPVIEASCYLPLNAAIVVHLFLALNHTLPHTLHEVFLSLVLCCIIRHLTRQAEEGTEAPDISSLDDLPPDVQEPFDNICAMAYHGVMKNKATFSATDLQSFNLPTELSTLSLIQGVQSFTAFKPSVSCNFLHLSVQELLGAYYISKFPAAKQIQIFNDLFDQPRLAAVFQFYAAFTKLQTKGVRDIVARIVQKKQKPHLVNLLHGLYEAQDVSLCEFVASHLKGEVDVSENTLSPMDCLVVGYFISCACLTTTSGEFNVNLSSCSLDEHRVSLLVRELSSSSLKSLRTLDFSSNHLSDGGVVHIAEILRHSNCLKTLNISHCCIHLDDQGIMKSLASALQMNSSLEWLNMSGNRAVTGVLLMALGESLKRNGALKTLNVSSCSMDDQGVKSLTSTLGMNASLEELYLSGNGAVTGVGFMVLGALKTLDISFCSIDDQGMKSLASALEMNGSLEWLNLDGNDAVTGSGLMALGKSLKRNGGLKELMFGLRNVPDKDWRQFIVCLQENNHLIKLLLPYSSTRDLVRHETETVNLIRRQKTLRLLEVRAFLITKKLQINLTPNRC